MKKIILILIMMIPLAFAIPVTTYDYDKQKTCEGNKCTLTLYSGTEYAKNLRGDFVPFEKAESLLDNGFKIVYLEKDKDLDIRVIDFNATSITVDLNAGLSILPKSIPVKIWTTDNSAITKDNLKTTATKLSEDLLSFSLIKQTYRQTYSFAPNSYILEFGSNSTTIILKDDGQNLADTHFESATAAKKAYNYGAATTMDWDETMPILIMFNFSSIPSSAIINWANLSLRASSSPISGTRNALFKYVNHAWNEGTSVGNPNDYTYNGSTWNQWWYSNDSSTNWTTGGGDYGATFSTVPMANSLTWYNLSILGGVQNWVNGSKTNIGFGIVSSDAISTNYVFYTKEYTTASNHPYVTVNYDGGCGAYTSGNYTIDCTTNCFTPGLINLGGNWFITTGNGTITTTNDVLNKGGIILSNGCKIVIGSGKKFT